MIASAAFVGSVLLSTSLLKERGSGGATAMSENTSSFTRGPDMRAESGHTTSFIASNTASKSKKRKQPLASRGTRAPGELEAAESAFFASLAALKSLSQVGL